MRRSACVLIAAVTAWLMAAPVSAVTGSVGYGDPPGWCTRFSDMWTATVVTNDPLVSTNPERNTFFGFHPNPGYDDWFGYFYGDFRGQPGDASGWVKLLHERYPQHYSWNFADSGWAVHGHAKEYIAYYNWTFGGQCGFGRYGSLSPPPYMADQYGWPVVDIYVDAVAPFAPQPRVVATTPTSVTFTWDPVADQGDGAGQDFFIAGMDHYVSWATIDAGPRQQLASTSFPRSILVSAPPGHKACVHVEAVDRVGNATPEETACGTAIGTPPMPAWPPLNSKVTANPSPAGLVGLDTWLWLDPQPAAMSLTESYAGALYRVVAEPSTVEWTFGDGAAATDVAPDAFGRPFPTASPVTHLYEAHSETGYFITASVVYDVRWSAYAGGSLVGPYPLKTVTMDAISLSYPVMQAQPELLRVGG